jgi:hypothetical protein
MSSSSRSIAAARQKRAGEQAPPMNNSRPVTSISSQGAFAQQQQYQQQQMMNQSIPIGSKNVRIAQNRSQTVGPGGRMNQTNQTNQSPQDQTTKISISNAVGLITLRLGRLENIVNDAIEDGSLNNINGINSNDNSTIPSNMKLVSDEVFENIVNRLNLLESKVINFTNQNENFVKEMSGIQFSINNFNATLSSFMNEMNEKFIDYDNALGEIEKNIEINDTANMVTSEQSEVLLPHNESNESLASNETEENEETEQDGENN